MKLTICLTAALFAFTIGLQSNAEAQALSPFVQVPNAQKGTQLNPFSIPELAALKPLPAQAWVYGTIKTIHPSIGGDPLDVDIVLNEGPKVRVNLIRPREILSELPSFVSSRPQKIQTVENGVIVTDASKPRGPIFTFENNGHVLLGLNLNGKKTPTGVLGNYFRPRIKKDENGPLSIPR
jgi:hypothetical protein